MPEFDRIDQLIAEALAQEYEETTAARESFSRQQVEKIIKLAEERAEAKKAEEAIDGLENILEMTEYDYAVSEWDMEDVKRAAGMIEDYVSRNRVKLNEIQEIVDNMKSLTYADIENEKHVELMDEIRANISDYRKNALNLYYNELSKTAKVEEKEVVPEDEPKVSTLVVNARMQPSDERTLPVFELTNETKKEISQMMQFTFVPSYEEVCDCARKIYDTITRDDEFRRAASEARANSNQYNTCEIAVIPPTGPNFMSTPLVDVIARHGYKAVAPFSKRISREVTEGDKTFKKQEFVYEGLVDMTVPRDYDTSVRNKVVHGAKVDWASINLTQHKATRDQIGRCVVEPKETSKSEIQKVLTFDSIPSAEEMTKRAQMLADYAFDCGYKKALVGGAAYFMPYLEQALVERDIQPEYSFTKQVIQPDGTRIFKEEGVVAVTSDLLSPHIDTNKRMMMARFTKEAERMDAIDKAYQDAVKEDTKSRSSASIGEVEK